MEQKNQSQFIARIFPILSIIEKIALVALFIGLVFKILHLNGADQILMISMTTLAIVCFLSAYKPPDENGGWKPLYWPPGMAASTVGQASQPASEAASLPPVDGRCKSAG